MPKVSSPASLAASAGCGVTSTISLSAPAVGEISVMLRPS
jgi:hypothetical protein